MQTLRLPEELSQRLDAVAKATREPRTALIADALRSYLDGREDLEIALARLRDPGAQAVEHVDVKRILRLKTIMKRTTLPLGWGEQRVQKVLAHCESQTEEEAAAEDEAASADEPRTVIGVPTDLVPAVRQLIAKHRRQRQKRGR